MKHVCHAIGCDVETSPVLFVCGKHWSKLPPEVQHTILTAYVPGQENTKRPSLAWKLAATRARRMLAEAEGYFAAARFLSDVEATYLRKMAS